MHDMRNLFLFVVVALALGSLGPAQAQLFPPDKLLGGGVKLAVGAANFFGGSCYVNRGSSQFQRNGLGPKAVISFDEIVDSGSGDSRKWELRGQAVLTFTTATSGNILFSRENMLPPLTVSNPSFQNYAQTYDPVGLRLVVTFSIVFPDCTVPVFAVFDTT
ncbi:MAG: hypothetical protein WA624_13125 [Methylocella sp.]